MQEKQLWFLGQEDPLEKELATLSSILAGGIPWTEEPGRLQFMGSWRVGHGWATSLSLFIFMHWRRKWQPTPMSLPGESRDGGAWWAAIYGVAQSRTRLKRLSSSSAIYVCKWGWGMRQNYKTSRCSSSALKEMIKLLQRVGMYMK